MAYKWSGTTFWGGGTGCVTYQAKQLWPLQVSRLSEVVGGGGKLRRGWRVYFDGALIPTGRKHYRTAQDAQQAAERLFNAVMPGMARLAKVTVSIFGHKHELV